MWKTLSVSLFIIVNSEKIEEHQRQQDSLPMKKKKIEKNKKSLHQGTQVQFSKDCGVHTIDIYNPSLIRKR